MHSTHKHMYTHIHTDTCSLIQEKGGLTDTTCLGHVLEETPTLVRRFAPSLGVTEGAGLAVVSLAQSRKCAGDKAAMWQDVMDF